MRILNHLGDRSAHGARDPRVIPSTRFLTATRAGEAAVAVLMLVFATAPSLADRCATPGEMSTLRVAAFQQQLMVAALTCHKIGSYNRFVRAYRPSLLRSDRDMLQLFIRLDGTDGEADYNAYKTRLANLAVLRNNASGGGYCREARADFGAAASNRRPLSDFVATRRLDVRLPYEECAGTTNVAAHEETQTPPPAHRRHWHRHRIPRTS